MNLTPVIGCSRRQLTTERNFYPHPIGLRIVKEQYENKAIVFSMYAFFSFVTYHLGIVSYIDRFAYLVLRYPPPTPQYFDQSIDHFSNNTDSFVQTYLLNDTFWNPENGPIFLIVGGEYSAETW